MKIGDCLSKKESYIEALLNYKEALNIKKTIDAYAKVAQMYEIKNDFPKAIENYEAALNLSQAVPESTRRSYLFAIGRLHLKMGQCEAAIVFLEDLLDGSESVEIFKLLGEAYFGSKQYSVALGYFEKANGLA
jgi:tetratricopeptide (TPR) repeat protein